MIRHLRAFLKASPCGTVAVVMLVLALAASQTLTQAMAQEDKPEKIKFLGVEISTTDAGDYKVLDNVNVRAKPDKNGKRVGSLIRGNKADVAGSPGKGWLAVRKDGKDFGFAYEPALKLIEVVKADFSISLTPETGNYLVFKDANVRAKPLTKSKLVGKLKKGEYVEAIGRPKDKAWLGVKQDGEELGYVHTPALLPLIDGELDENVAGSTLIKDGPSCGYAVRYDGKSSVEDEISGTFDYDIAYRCKKDGVKFGFMAFMFITETSFDLSNKRVHQINVDVLEIGDRFDEVMSVIFMYHVKENKLTFDSVSQEEFGHSPAIKEKKVNSIKEALAAAAKIAPSAWNDEVWKSVASEGR